MIRLLATLAILLAAPAQADDDTEMLRIGDDVYLAGGSVALTTSGIDDVFAAGERVTLDAAISGTAHLAGRRVTTDAAIGGGLYAAGADVTVAQPVAGDATLAAYDVNVDGDIGGDLRAAAAHVRVSAPVAGTALLTGSSVYVGAAIEGDTIIAAESLEFGPDAKINGMLTLYGDVAEASEVPESVAPAANVTRRDLPSRLGRDRERSALGWLAIGGGLIIGTLVITLLVAIIATFAPASMERFRDITRDRPFRTFWFGFLTLSVLLGATFLLVLTLVGIFVAPLVLLCTVAAAFLGYLIAIYVVGRAILGRFDTYPPDTFPERLLTALVGAVAVALLTLIPLFGWLVVMLLTLIGLGALTVAVFSPRFRAGT